MGDAVPETEFDAAGQDGPVTAWLRPAPAHAPARVPVDPDARAGFPGSVYLPFAGPVGRNADERRGPGR